MIRVAAGEVIEGWLPRNAVRLVKEWRARHRADWSQTGAVLRRDRSVQVVFICNIFLNLSQGDL